jgi:hypothetical protein
MTPPMKKKTYFTCSMNKRGFLKRQSKEIKALKEIKEQLSPTLSLIMNHCLTIFIS